MMLTRLLPDYSLLHCTAALCVVVFVACGTDGLVTDNDGDDEQLNVEQNGGDNGSDANQSDNGDPDDNNDNGDPDDNNDNGDPDDNGDPVDCSLPAQSSLNSPSASDSWRFGGGTGYPDAIERDDNCMEVVDNASDLVAALQNADPEDVIYVDDDARIDLSSTDAPCINDGVWLVSGRGFDGSPGGVIKTGEADRPMLEVCGDDVRISGLRILGNDPDECPDQWPNNCPEPDNTGGVNCRDCTTPSIGIESHGNDNLQLDNNELAGWAHAALYVTDGVDIHVHHNYIHHTWRQGLGYGVVLMRGISGGSDVVEVLVEWNRFNYNRHAIAGSGEPGQSYVARDNLVDRHANGHVFDMHGYDEDTGTGSDIAGTEIEIYYNTVLVDDYYTKVIRGVPEDGSWLYGNCLARSSAADAANQSNFYGNFHVDEDPAGNTVPNQYGQGPDDCERERWCYAPGGTGGWTYGSISGIDAGSLHLDDFNGDGHADVFRTSGGQWQIAYGASGSFDTLNTSNRTLDELGFGDFNGDGQTDVFYANGSQWRISWGGTSSWDTVRNSSTTLDDLAFGDFNGDGTTDVFSSSNGQWRVSWGADTAWETINSSNVDVDDLGFADFNGDGTTDVFRTTGSQWRVSWGGTSSWDTLNNSGIELEQLKFGDFNGDGTDDVLRPRGNEWLVSWGGQTPWETLRISSLDNDEILVGDITGDGADDIFTSGCH